MKKIDAIVSRFPQHELTIHRLYALDADFKAACEDYEEAMAALRYWQPRCAETDPRIEQYHQLLNDLQCEIAGKIEGADKTGDAPTGGPPPGRPEPS